MPSTRTVRVKICGITTPEAAAAAAAAGADAIGLVFHPASPRYVSDLGLAREIALAAGPLTTVVALFVNAPAADVERKLGEVPLGLLQFHGDENDVFCRSFKRPYIKALRMKPGVAIDALAMQYSGALGLLLDAYRPGVPGGTGATFDWQTIPPDLPRPLILAGGLNVSNIVDAVAKVRPWAVDVSGGVEAAPGVKDLNLIRDFILRAKSISIPIQR